jgi:hypothetical protein
MTPRKTLKWTLAGLVVLLALVYAGLHVWRWMDDKPYETVLVIENRSGQPVHNLEIAHNGEVVYQTRRLDPHKIIALANLDPLEGPEAEPPSTDIRLATARAAVSFTRVPGGQEERLAFSAGGHHLSLDKCLIAITITPQSIERRGCIWMSKPKQQTKPKN